jgi:hypothetical protein
MRNVIGTAPAIGAALAACSGLLTSAMLLIRVLPPRPFMDAGTPSGIAPVPQDTYRYVIRPF